ncbi:hypothetical protein BRDID11002_59050 [Bradyrhizobium diazoefficiens]|uniref:Uncharacterized protein n=2 Tax=Bradyrhizobium TaxID=374 RepID=A0A809WSJ0_9BRAD|nr:hypothetical protein XF1B_04460 [Bradyrhizobium diazoefficiens]BCF22493.1 hypothetical protein XF14B_04450 [Bradyrhizobium diazoefficiens]
MFRCAAAAMVTAIMAGTAIVVITTAGIMGVAIGGIVTKGGDWAGLDGRPGFDAHRGLARVIVLLESNSTMKVRELVQELQALPDQDAIVVIGEGSNPLIWLLVTGIIERGIAFLDENPDFAKPGPRRAYEIV